MKIAVIAAGGRSGQVFVEAALAAGHSVHAGTMHTNHLKPHPKLSIMTCDATLEADLTNLLRGQDAVASFIGHVKGSPENIQSVATQNTTTVMKRVGISRIVSLTGTDVRIPGDHISIIDRICNLGIFLMNPTRVWDERHHAKLLQSSDHDWTIIRAPRPVESQAVPFFELREHGPAKWQASREEVAQATLQVLEDHSFIRQMPMICSPASTGPQKIPV